ncbi:MAG TPA: Wzz/FepE/Etk N-terminal domain-containing protein [Bryobacteraceae bacterium]|nr:Wzz/FepE/Etk N-terminal domain-containing protein [Bryobacteraceae bacterium]
MYETFDALDYIDYLLRRWRVVASACLAAGLLSLGVSLLLPKRYTATASIVIEPPGGSDARLTTAVSAMYLESLKTYELFASSDTLFAHAAREFHLDGRSQSLESLKRQVLKVSKLRDTKVLQISATLRGPKEAQALAQYLAGETVNLSRQESRDSDQDFVQQAVKQASAAQHRVEDLQKQWNALVVNQPVESLQSEIDSDVDLRAKVQEQLLGAQTEIAEYQPQQSDGQFAREQLQGAQARVAVLAKRSQDLDRNIQTKTALLAIRTAHRQGLETELRVAQESYKTIATRLEEYRATAGTHAEQLRVIDPGIVPERPSSPNISLNVAVALFVTLLAALVYLSATFVYGRRSIRYEATVARGMHG